MLEISQGNIEELALIEGVLIEAASRIKKTGSTQWAHVLDGGEHQNLKEKIIAGNVYLVKKAEALAAIFYLTSEPSAWDQDLWQSLPVTRKTYYLHKLALVDEFTGQGLAKEILHQVQKEFSQLDALISIRLDCIATQPYLNHLYPNSGFTKVGLCRNLHSGSLVADFNLYEWENS